MARFSARPILLAAGFSLLLLLALFPAVRATSAMHVPAVDLSGQGTVTSITVEARAGSGKVFVDISPYFSIETQQSSRNAEIAAASAANANRSLYDVFIQIAAPAQVVDGPSGGSALATLMYSEFTHQTPRPDLSMTGTINPDGSIGRIGGLMQKAQAASQAGVKVLLIPDGQATEGDVDLTAYGPQVLGMQIVEVRNLQDALAIAFSPTGSPVNATPHVIPPLSVAPLAPSPGMQRFAPIAQNTLSSAGEQLAQLLAKTGPTIAYNRSRVSLNESSYLFANGYSYSAANNAFLTQATVFARLHGNDSRESLSALAQSLLARAQAAQPPQKTVSNFEWAISSELRTQWANSRLQAAVSALQYANSSTTEQANGIEVAQGWLDAGKQLAQIADEQAASRPSARVEDSQFKTLAAQKIADAKNQANDSLEPVDPEAALHLENARNEFAAGRYAAAYIDAVFSLSFSTASSDYASQTLSEDLASVGNSSGLADLNDSAWAQLYYSHALYYLQSFNRTQDPADLLGAMKLSELAYEFRDAVSPDALPTTASAPAGGLNVTVVTIPAPINQPNIPWLTVVLLIIVALIVLTLAYLLLSPRRNAGNSKGAAGKLDSLDDALVEGRISESTFKRLAARYKERAKEEKRTRRR